MADRGSCRHCRKRTSAKDDHGFICVTCSRSTGRLVDRRGGDRKSKRFRGQDSEVDLSSPEESGYSPEPTKCGQISFLEDKYVRDAEYLSGLEVDVLVHDIDEQVGVKNVGLLKSFLYFWCLMLLQQPKVLVPDETKHCIEAWVARGPALHRNIAQYVPLLGKVPPILDGAMRSRPKFAVAMWKKVWRRQPVTEARVAAWVLLVACFRYLGTQQFMEDAMLAGAKESLSAGLTEESLEAVVGGLEHSIREALKFRTSVSVSWAKLVIIAKEAMKRS